MTHRFILNGVDIRHMGKPDAAANQLGAAESDGIVPDLFQERRGIARRAERGVARFLVRQRLEALREGVPQFLNIGQALLARGGGIANAQMPRQAAEVQQQVADGSANVKANRAKVAELGVDGLQAAVGHKN